MTEQEYINVSDKAKIGSAIDILREIVPDNSEIIDSKELTEITSKLWGWRDKLHESINIKE